MNDNNALFKDLLRDIGCELYLTKDLVANGATFDRLVKIYLTSRNSERTYIEPIPDSFIQQIKENFGTITAFAEANPYAVFNRYDERFEMLGNFEASDIADCLSVWVEDSLTVDLFDEFEAYYIEPTLNGEQLTRTSSIEDFASYGTKIYLFGSDREKLFYEEHKANFDALSMVAMGCPNVDLKQIAGDPAKIFKNKAAPVEEVRFRFLDKGTVSYDPSRIDPETNDYLILAHISEEGAASFFTEDISETAKSQILEFAQRQKEKFSMYWNELPVEKRYEALIDRADVPTLLEITRDNLSMTDAVAKYEEKIIYKSDTTGLREGKKHNVKDEEYEK